MVDEYIGEIGYEEWDGEAGRRYDLGLVESKPRDPGSDRGYRVVAAVWALLSLNPHPF